MKQINLKIGDKVELWNGTTGEVFGLEFPMITISNPNSFTQKFHLMNLKFVNGMSVDGMDVIFLN